MKVLILAAGYAVRLYPLTLNAPKSLLRVAGKKIIDRILERCAKLKNVTSIFIITNDKFFKNFSVWLEGSVYKDAIFLINDGTASNETRLGAIRDLEMAIKEKDIKDDLLVVASDNLFELDLNEFVIWASSRPDGASIAAYDVGALELARNFGVVKIDGDARVVRFDEKPAQPSSTLISTGIYYFPRSKLALVDDYISLKDKNLDAPGYFFDWLSKVDKLYGFKFKEDWYDIGDIESYKKADFDYSQRERTDE